MSKKNKEEELKLKITLQERKVFRAKAEALSWARDHAVRRFNYPANKPIPSSILLRIADSRPEVIEIEKKLEELQNQLIAHSENKSEEKVEEISSIEQNEIDFYYGLMDDLELVINTVVLAVDDVRKMIDSKDVRNGKRLIIGDLDSNKIWYKIMENMTINISYLSDCMDGLRRLEPLSKALEDNLRLRLLTERVKDLKSDAKLFLDLAKNFSFNNYD